MNQEKQRRKYNELNLKQKIDLLDYLKQGNSERQASQKFNISKGAVSNIKNKADQYLKQYAEEGCDHDRFRKFIKTEFDEINHLTWQWFLKARAQDIPLTGPILKEVALEFAESLKQDNFKASDGWLDSFKSRHQIVFKILSGEGGSCDIKKAEEFKQCIVSYCEGYKKEQIFNADETALFFRSLPNKSLIQKYKNSKGLKYSKERITILLATSLIGEKLKPVIIGKTEKPRCFKKLNIENLPVTYCYNKKAWMTTKIFEQWLITLNEQLIKENRKILLFIDNSPSHPKLIFSNLKCIFLPPNLTPILQPLDQGIINSFKSNYRKCLTRYLIAQVNNNQNSNLQKISLLDAIYWIKSSWDQITNNCIQSCFFKAGFNLNQMQVEMEQDQKDEFDEDFKIAKQLKIADKDISIQEYTSFDNKIPVETEIKNIKDLIAEVLEENKQNSEMEVENEGQEESEIDSESEEEVRCPTHEEVRVLLNQLKIFALNQEETLLHDIKIIEKNIKIQFTKELIKLNK